MISVVCVYNDAQVLEARLLNGLRRQTARHDIVTVDNRGGRFRHAAEALNWGAGRTTGDWIMFTHQDVELLSPDWLTEAERMLAKLRRPGWTGVAGMTKRGAFRGLLLDSANLLGNVFDCPQQVQTLDECLLIRRRQADPEPYFDEAVEGWHAYGVEACCRASSRGEKNYVVPLPIWHDSKGTNQEGLSEAHEYVWRKHGPALRRISTTCGILPHVYDSNRGGGGPTWKTRVSNHIYKKTLRDFGLRVVVEDYFGEVLESMTKDAAVVDVMHRRGPVEKMEAQAFVAQTTRRRRVVHYFRGFEYGAPASDRFVVIAPDLSARLRETDEVLSGPAEGGRLLLCVNVVDIYKNMRFWRIVRRRSISQQLVLKWDETINWDGMARAIAVFEIDWRSSSESRAAANC